ncbi:MAG: TOBE domain-containing protein, partial [Pseudomonadota bacterium]|nr:TOBE domain-containing protein [Pseudomonadota bacterium]
VAENVRVEGLSAPDGPVTLGFRAEDAGLGDAGHHEITAPIYTLELLGDATMVTVRIGGELVAVRAPKDYRSEIGDTVSLSVPAEICHLFDAETGARIEA